MNESHEKRRNRHGLVSGLILGAVGGALLAGALWTTGVSAAPGSFGFHRGHHGGALSRDHLDFASEYVLSRLEATEDQRAAVKAVLDDAFPQAESIRERHRANREAFLDALSQPTVDRQALESARTTEMQIAEDLSQLLVDAIARTAEALTPEQRSELIEHVRNRAR